MGVRGTQAGVSPQLKKSPTPFPQSYSSQRMHAWKGLETVSLMWHSLPWMSVRSPVLLAISSKVVNPVFLQEPLRYITVILLVLLGAQQALQHDENGIESDRGLLPSDGFSKLSVRNTYGEIIAHVVGRKENLQHVRTGATPEKPP